jgi:hypothetical protein
MREACVLSALALLFYTSAAYANLCGDNVQGQGVPCACGDTVVSDVVLTPDHPVANTVCPGDGLVVRSGGASGITIDLNGMTLRGSGQGAGLWLLYGGSGGARIVSTGQVAHLEGFRDGVVAQGADSLAVLDNVAVARSVRDGVRVHGANYSVHATDVVDSGRDGFSFGGHDYEATATRAMNNGRYGYSVTGMHGVMGTTGAGNTSQGSGDAGLNLNGMMISVTDCVVTSAAKNGVQLNGMAFTIEGCTVTDNLQTGIIGAGIDWHLRNNQAARNGYDGLVVRGMNVTDEGGNSGIANHGQRWQREAIQCTVNGVPCVQ